MSQDLPSGDNTQQVADIQWNEERQPICQRFDDVYFSTDDGLEETRHNFIRPSRLSERFPALEKNDVFRIGETGFGTGLSFLACWHIWQQSNSLGQLEFYSVEKYPLNRAQLKKALVQFPELEDLAEALCENYPSVAAAGWHRLEFEGVRLQLFIGDVVDGLLGLCRTRHPRFLEQNRQFDAWFLDGFSPAKNPDMWRKDVLECITSLSKQQATVATFTAVSAVRKSLEAHGFDMKKASGFGLKREMMTGEFTRPLSEERNLPSSVFNKQNEAPWDLDIHLTENQQQVCIIGGGIAASCNARALAAAGFSVTILERHKALAQEGSGNPQGVLYAKLSHRPETLSQFNLHCLLFAQRFYRAFLNNREGNTESHFEADLCGVVQMAQDEKHDKQQGQLLDYLTQFGPTEDFVQQLSAKELSRISGVNIDKPGLYFPNAGWLNPASACEALCHHPNIEVRYEQEVEHIRRDNGLWQCLSASGNIVETSELLIVANANDAKRFEQCTELPLKPVRGQVSYLDASSGSKALKAVICGRGYIVPERKAQHCLGASFNLHERSLDLRTEEQQSNFQHLQDDCPGLFSTLNTEEATTLRGRVALRCTSPDYLPLVGPVPDISAMQERFALLSRNAKTAISTPGCYHEGLYISVAYGSRGLCYAPLAAAELLSQIQRAPSVLGASIRKALNPARFTIRDMIRRKRPNPAVKA